jgi:5-methylcytosine-specific restriction endonuclease McrA
MGTRVLINGTRYYCGRPMQSPTRDHIRPVIYGGSLTDQNKVIVCEPCNHDKGHHTLTDWARHLRRDGDPRAATVAAYRTARKAAKAAEREATI